MVNCVYIFNECFFLLCHTSRRRLPQPEGATIDRHTSILLDLKNRAVVYEYMDIIVEESYVIPLSIFRRFVAGSPRGHVSLCGDVVGPSFPYGVSGFRVPPHFLYLTSLTHPKLTLYITP